MEAAKKKGDYCIDGNNTMIKVGDDVNVKTECLIRVPMDILLRDINRKFPGKHKRMAWIHYDAIQSKITYRTADSVTDRDAPSSRRRHLAPREPKQVKKL